MNYKERQEIIAKSPISFAYLKRFNIGAGILHFVQGIVMLALGLSKAYNLDIYTFYLKFNIIPPNIQIGPDPKIARARVIRIKYNIELSSMGL